MYKGKIESCAQRILKALDIKGMKRSELCKFANVPKSSLSLYISGAYEPKQDRVYDMAKVLNVSEAWLMGYDVPMERNETPRKESELDRELKQWLSKATDSEKQALLNLLKSINNK